MDKVRLGKSGMKVTKVGFGGIPIQRLTEEDAISVVRRALDLGIDWIDTANGYTVSEGIIGKAIKGYDREKLKIFTKSGAKEFEELESHINLSFQRLQVDYIDLFQFHNVSTPEHLAGLHQKGLLDLVKEYKEKGLIRHIGASSHTIENLTKIVEIPEIEVIQFPFNFIVEDLGRKALDLAKEKDLGFIAMKPFGGGALDNADLCVRFLMQFPNLVLDPGFEAVEQVEEVVRIAKTGAPLTADDKKKMHDISKAVGRNFCRRCQYCMPCSQGVNIVSLMTMESALKRLPKEKIIDTWRKAAESQKACIECGVCETRCPYKLPIMERIKYGAKICRDYLKEQGC